MNNYSCNSTILEDVDTILQLFSEKLYFFKYKYSFFEYNCKNNKASTLPLIIYNS